MKKASLILAVCITFSIMAGHLPLSAGSQKSSATSQGKKKGVGLSESHGLGAKQLEALNVSWYYNWSDRSKVGTKVELFP